MLYKILVCLAVLRYVDATFKAIYFPAFAVGLKVVIAGCVLEGKEICITPCNISVVAAIMCLLKINCFSESVVNRRGCVRF
jgi:hypothetical protein